jgi:hypothetical protein
MKERMLTTPQLLFVVGTRAALGAGVALLASSNLTDRTRRRAGLTLALAGIATTIPAARLVVESGKSPFKRMLRKLW